MVDEISGSMEAGKNGLKRSIMMKNRETSKWKESSMIKFAKALLKTATEKHKLWHLFMDRVQLFSGCRATTGDTLLLTTTSQGNLSKRIK